MILEFPLLEVEGSAYEMGFQHGRGAGLLVRKYLQLIQHLTGKPLEALCQNAVLFQPTIERFSASYMQEIRGLANGAEIPLSQALLCQLRTEASRDWEGGCTAFALEGDATSGGEVLLGQNQDMEPEFSDVALLLHVRPGDGRPRALMFTYAGQLGYSGMNQFGVAHFSNALYGFEWRPGLPHYPLKRVLLEQRTVEDCLALIRQHRVCSAANLVLADRSGTLADVEIRPDGIAVYEDDTCAARLHTNHYLSGDYRGHEDNFLPDSIPRLERIRALVRAAWGEINVGALKAILADHDGDPAGICRHGARNLHTISGYIAQPSRGLLHIRRGYGCSGTWTSYAI